MLQQQQQQTNNQSCTSITLPFSPLILKKKKERNTTQSMTSQKYPRSPRNMTAPILISGTSDASGTAAAVIAGNASSSSIGIIIPYNTNSTTNTITCCCWHKDIEAAIQTNQWQTVRSNLKLVLAQQQQNSTNNNNNNNSSFTSSSSGNSDPRYKSSFKSLKQQATSSSTSFWNRISQSRGSGNNSGISDNNNNKTGPLWQQQQQQMQLLQQQDPVGTPLHAVLASRKSPSDVVLQLLQAEPRAAATPNPRGRLPLHFCVVHRRGGHSNSRDTGVIVAALVEAHPAAIGSPDTKGQSPLQYSVDIAKRESAAAAATATNATTTANANNNQRSSSSSNKAAPPPRTFWMPLPDHCAEEAAWQHEQAERWAVVHWLLLSSATHPQTSLSVVGTTGSSSNSNSSSRSKPMLVEALLAAAPPAVIALLIGASVMLLSYENRATAFAGSTLYACITRHYPLTILMSLASQCPPDVHNVHDETGMGLVSAQYIAGCYEQLVLVVPSSSSAATEWTVCEDFYACLIECMQEGEIGDDPAVSDWWRKIEFLIAFCACGKLNCSGRRRRRDAGRSSSSKSGSGTAAVKKHFEASSFPREYLLHAALLNIDTPPTVIRMLLALYPKSITLKDPSTGALPLHLAAMKRDYVPRHYEVQTTTTTTTGSHGSSSSSTAVEIILEADRSAVHVRHEGRLPLHYAIASGRTIETLAPLLVAAATTTMHEKTDDRGDDDVHDQHPQLLLRDPTTNLYPFLLAATYPNKSNEDSFRWSCVARNQYSNAEWQGLSDRRKASAVLKVAESEDVARIDTIYELLRRQPGVICDQSGQHQLRRRSAKGNIGSRNSVNFARDSTGKGVVAAHYIAWCFTEKVEKVHGITWEPNAARQDMLRQAVQVVSTTGKFPLLPPEFDTWWTKLIFYLRQQGVTQHDKFEAVIIPPEQDEYLLHAALSNSDTPPEIVEILLAADSKAASLSLPGSSLLPLHIASRTQSYIPLSFERYQHSAIHLTLKAHPMAARVMSNGQLPLHMAIAAGKSLRDVECFVREEPRSLGVKDRATGLYPFQLMAIRQQYTPDQRLQFQYLARNRFGEKAWNDLAPQARTKQVQHVQKEHELNVLSSIFFLLRSDPTALKLPSLELDDASDSESAMTGYLSRTVSMQTPSLATRSSDVSATESEDSFVAKSKESVSPVVRAHNPLSLMLLLSQHHLKHSNKNDDIFECDASVFSNVDVMSTLTSTNHTSIGKKQRAPSKESADEESINIFSCGGDANEDDSSEEETSYDDFAEDSDLQGSSSQVTDYDDGDGSAVLDESENSEEDGTDLPTDDESVVSFDIRRLPRFSSGKMRDGDAAPASVKLIKKPPHSLLAEIQAHSLSSREVSATPVSEPSISSSTIDKNSVKSRFSYKSLRSEEIARMNGSTEMMWMSPDLLNTNVSGQGGTCCVDNEHSSVSMSLSSSDRREESVAGGSTKTGDRINVTEKTGRPQTLNSTPISSRASASKRSDPRVTAKKGRSIQLNARSSCLSGIPSSTIQASLLGNYGDSDAIEDDPLLNMDPEHPIATAIRSVSDHNKKILSNKSQAITSNHLDSELKLSSISDHVSQTSRSSLLLGLNGSSSSTNDDVLLDINPLPINVSPNTGTGEGSKFVSSCNLAVASQTRASSSIAADDEMKSKKAASAKGDTIASRAEQSSSLGNGSSGTDDRRNDKIAVRSHVECADSVAAGLIQIAHGCASPSTITSNDRTVDINEAIATPVSTKYFDKASMRWKERPKERETDQKPAMRFDKQSMRWVVKNDANELSQRVQDREPHDGEPQLRQQTMPTSAFDDLLSSKAAQISKTERHQTVANMGRSQFRGKSPNVMTPNIRAKSGQLTSMFSSSQSRLACLICKENEREVLMVPCRHLCICRRCSVQQTRIANCPLCSERVTGIMIIF